MAKGLPWIRISSEIPMDGDLEFVSDAAFRTYVEIIALSGYYLLDGQVPLKIIKKQCNTADVDGALEELAAGGYIQIGEDALTVPSYSKWQQTSEQIEAKRKKGAERAQRLRDGEESNAPRNGVTDGVSNSSTSVRVQSKTLEQDQELGATTAPESPTEGDPGTLVAYAVDYARHKGLTPPARGHMGKVVKELLKDGAKFGTLVRAVERLVDQGKTPANLRFVLGDIEREQDPGGPPEIVMPLEDIEAWERERAVANGR